jgi:hypothetical protein
MSDNNPKHRAFLGSLLLGISTLLPQSMAVVTTPYYQDADGVACSGGTDRYCVSNYFTNGWQDIDFEFMEGDTPSGMYAVWFKEHCRDSTCYPELTCGGSSGEPISGDLRSTYFTNTDYTFDNLGCYFEHNTNPAVD